MKKRLLYTLLSVVFLVIATITVYNYSHVSKQEYLELSKNNPIRERLKLSKKERKRRGIPPNKFFDAQHLLEMDPSTGEVHPENLLKVKKQLHKPSTFFSKVPGQNAEMSWTERGPNNIAGRTRVVFYDPNDSTKQRVFAGGVSGGLWVNNNIEDENSLWNQVGIDENLSISCFTIDPNDSNTWYVGTGEVYTGNDGVGNGIWVTTNGGETWRQLLSVDLTTEVANRPYVITQILAWNNNGTTEVYYSIDGKFDYDYVGFQRIGWWKINNNSTNRINFLSDGGSPYVLSDVEIAKDNSIWIGTKTNIYGHGGGKIFRTVDGENFEEKYSFTNAERVELAVSKQNKNVVYALASTNNSERVELVKTTNGVNFSAISRPNDADADIPANDFARSQGFYNLTLEVDVTDDDILYAGGIDLFRSSNAGGSWKQISKWSNNNNLNNLNISLVHADQHAVVLNPLNSNKGLFANDGGIYYCEDLTQAATTDNITARNKNYNITQFYSADISQDVNDEFFVGGAQDNGSLYGGIEEITDDRVRLVTKEGLNSFIDLFTGDGIQNFIDKDGKYLIVSFINNVYSLYPLPLNGDNDVIEIISDQSTGSFTNIADLDDNSDILYTDGSRYFSDGTLSGSPKIFRFTELETSPQKRTMTSLQFTEEPTVIKVSPYTTNSSTLFIGTQGASVLKVINANTDNPIWENLDVDEQINTGAISDIEFGENENQIIVTLHNYGVDNIYYTTDGGVNWVSKDGNFPDIPVKTVQMNPLSQNEVILGTNMGVWATNNFTDQEPVWFQSFNGMSNVRVTKFEMRTADNLVIASTYGRGLFTGKFENEIVTPDPEPEPEETLEDKVEFESYVKGNKIKFEVDDTTDTNILNVFIYNTKGSLVSEQVLNLALNQTEISVLNYSVGVYIIKVIANGESFTKKVLIDNSQL